MDRSDWFQDVVERFESRLVGYAARLTNDVERARDVVQETFMKLLHQDRAVVEPRLKEWLFRVCRNRALDVRGKETRMQPLDVERVRTETCPAPTPPAAMEHSEVTRELFGMVSRLPEKQQEVLRLKFQEGLSYKEISRVTDHSVSYVGVLIHNALSNIRRRYPTSANTRAPGIDGSTSLGRV